MEYLLVGILVLLLVAGFVTFLFKTSQHREGRSGVDRAAGDRDDIGRPGIGPDATPLADTAEHAGVQDESGRTRSPVDAERAGGTGRATAGAESVPDAEEREPEKGGRFQRDPVGGEGEGRPYVESERSRRPR
jgi:hypothetical protein